jgi:hypothetical protein
MWGPCSSGTKIVGQISMTCPGAIACSAKTPRPWMGDGPTRNCTFGPTLNGSTVVSSPGSSIAWRR